MMSSASAQMCRCVFPCPSLHFLSVADYHWSCPYQVFAAAQVSCLADLENPLLFYRSVGLSGCSNTTIGSETAATDQADWDAWLARWKHAYLYGVYGVAVEAIWDLVEYAAYVVL